MEESQFKRLISITFQCTMTSSLAVKLLLLYVVLFASICLTSSVTDGYSISNLDLEKFTSEKEVFRLFEIWKEETKREYQKLEEEVARFQIFKSNLKHIKETNAERKSPSDYSLGLNKFSDMTYEEFSKIYLHESEDTLMESSNGEIESDEASDPIGQIPSSWDWRTKGAVTRVKDQGKCGGCWAFSATGAMEGINKIVKQSLPDLSEQQLISCVKNNKGCNGGWYGNAFQYVINNHGIASEKDYPYKAADTPCNSTLEKNKFVTIDSYKSWFHTPISESSLRGFVFKQPISVSIYASPHFKSYKSGIFKGDDCSGISSCNHNHAVLIVGYGSSGAGQDYWIVKNSWGTTWGQSGYIFIKRNTGASRGVCNINCSGAYPIKGNKEEASVLKLPSSI